MKGSEYVKHILSDKPLYFEQAIKSAVGFSHS